MPIDTERQSNGGSLEPAAAAFAPGAAPMGGKRTTLAQVAALAGVSVSTASLAFSGAGPVSEATRHRVLAAAERLHYAGPDPRGRSLRQGRSGIIGVVMEERVLAAFRDPIRIAMLDGIAQATTADGRGLLLLTDVGESATTLETASMDGVVLLSCSTHVARSIDVLRRRGTPTVALGGPEFPGVLTITLDDEQASTVVARHLADLRHRDVAIVALPLDGVVDGSDSTAQRGALSEERERAGTVQVTLDRLRGVRAVFPGCPGVVSAGSFVDEGMIAGHTLLDDPDHRPTAIIAQSDLLAAGVIKAAGELGLDVPRDLSVVGYDGIALDRIIPHDLTTMSQPAAEQGRAAGQAVLDLLDGGHPDPVRFASTFHLGATTGPPRGR
ncbi:LacI family DNA-binding transcriptional regulator [Nakamurella sp. GG22]